MNLFLGVNGCSTRSESFRRKREPMEVFTDGEVPENIQSLVAQNIPTLILQKSSLKSALVIVENCGQPLILAIRSMSFNNAFGYSDSLLISQLSLFLPGAGYFYILNSGILRWVVMNTASEPSVILDTNIFNRKFSFYLLEAEVMK